MALSTKWVDYKPTNPVTAAWLNDVDDIVYTIFGGGTPTGGNTANQLLWITASDTISMGSAATAAGTAVFELNSTTKGFLPPRMTTAQRTAISAPPAGLMVYDSDLNITAVYNGSGWDTMETPWTVSGANISYTAGNTTISDLIVTTTATFNGATIADLGTVTTANIDGGTLDGVVIGATSQAAGDFTAIGAVAPGSGVFTTLNATGGGALTGTWTNLGSVTTVDINGGTIDGATIGAASATTGKFTTIESTGVVGLGQAPGTQQLEITAAAGKKALYLEGAANSWTSSIYGNATSGQSYGLEINAGTTSGDKALQVNDETGAVPRFIIRGDGKGSFGGTGFLGTFHIETSSAGAISPGASYDELVLENSGNCGLTIAAGTTSSSSIAAADSGGATQGYLSYDHSTDKWIVGAGNADRMHIITGMYMQGATGGDQGAGTINATGLYVNGVAVTSQADPLQLSDNDATTPTYSFSGDTDTGMYRTTTPSVSFSVSGAQRAEVRTTGLYINQTGSVSAPEIGFAGSGGTDTGIYASGANQLSITCNGTEMFRVSTTAISAFEALNATQPTNGQNISTLTHSGATGLDGLRIDFSAASPDDNTAWFLLAEDSTTARCYIWSDGDLANHDGTYGTISDARYKTVLGEARSYWDDWKKLRYVNYEMHTGPGKKLFGLVAQEVEQVFPGCVSNAMIDDPENEGQKKEQKFIKSSILHEISGKVIQELQDRVEALEAKLGA